MEKLVEYIVKELVSKPEDVKITSKDDHGVIIIGIETNPEDVGRVIGKNGRIAQSIRTIVKTVSIKSGKRYVVKIGDR